MLYLHAERAHDARSAADLCANGPTLRKSGHDFAPLLELSDEEAAQNAARPNGNQLWLVPSGGLVHNERGYLFYDLREGKGPLDSQSLGTGLCVIEPDSTRCQRIESSNSTLLWTSDDRMLNQGGLVVGARGFVYGCRQVAALSRICTVSSAPLDSLTIPSAATTKAT